MGIKAMALDIDGTITDERRRGTCDVIEAIRKAIDAGVKVMIVSGNVLPVALGIAGYIGLNGPIVAENGGIIYYKGEITLTAENRFEDVKKAYDEIMATVKPEPRPLVTNRWRETELGFYPDAPLDRIKAIAEKYGLWAESTGFAHHINPHGVDKAYGLRKALEILDIPLEDTVAIGDHMTDIPMLRIAGYSGCPSQAPEEVKKVVKWVASKPYSHGTAEIIERYVLPLV